MEDFRFANPEYLFGLLLLPLLFWALSKLGRNARERLLRFVSEANLRSLLRDTGGRSSSVKTWLFWLGLVFLIVALARPQANPITEELEGTSLDIYVLLDVSKSMDAEDVAPSRLKKAKREIQSLMTLLAGDRLGLIAFAGSSVIVSPLTSDYEIVKTFLQNVDTNLIQNQTTNIQGALTLAEEAMRRGAERAGDKGARSNVFIVMSDGEDQAADPDYSVVNKIKSGGGSIFTIAFGTEAGAKIPVRNDRGEIMGYKRDRANGQEVTTSVATKSLQEIANIGGGQFYFSTQDEAEVQDILNRMQTLQRSGAVTMRARVYQEYFWPFLALGLSLVMLSFFSVRAMVGSLRSRAGAGLGLMILLAGLAWPVGRAEAAWNSFLWDKEHRASDKAASLGAAGKADEAVDALKGLLAEDPESGPLNYNVGTYYLTGKKAKEGREQLDRLRTSPSPLKAAGLFNIAGSYATEGKKPEARAAYAELIADLSAKEKLSEEESKILDLAKKNLVRMADPKQDPQQQQQKQDQDKKDQQDQDKKDGEGKPGDKGESKPGDKGDEKKPDDKDAKKPEDGKDPKDKDSKDGKDPKDAKDPKDGKDPKEDKKAGDGKEKSEEEQKKEEEQKQKEAEGKDGKDSKDQNKDQKPGEKRYASPKGFKERENLSGEDAKRLLEELKLNETNLQKKFLRKKDNGGKFGNDGAAKDW